MPIRSALFAAIVCCLAAPAAATSYCPVLKGPDGFVALRAGPGADFALLARMQEDDEVQLLDGRQGAWLQVRHWRGGERLQENTRDAFRTGWVDKRYLGECG